MAGRPSQEELELEPLLRVDPLHDMSSNTDQNDFPEDKLDVETADRRSSSSGSQRLLEILPEEKSLVRKLDTRIMPLACILYLFACECNSLPSIRALLSNLL